MAREPALDAALRFRQRLAGGAPVVGLFVKTASHQVVEVLGRAGLDYVVIDAEHAPFDRNTLDCCLLAARACALPALVRIPEPTAAAILDVLDMGAAGVMVPHVRGADDAARAVHFARYAGGRGYSNSTRLGDYGRRPMADHLRDADDASVVVAMVEDPQGIDRIEAIAAVEGVDAVFLGLADLAVAMSCSDPAHPAVAAAADRAFAAMRRCGRPVGALAADPAAMADFRARGVTMLLVGTDQGVLRVAVAAAVEAARAAV